VANAKLRSALLILAVAAVSFYIGHGTEKKVAAQKRFISSESDLNSNPINLYHDTIGNLASSIAENSNNPCSLPQEYVKPEVWAQFCGNSCRNPGLSCTEHSSCCSGMCIRGVCAANASKEQWVAPGLTCTDFSDCETNLCYPHPFNSGYKICYGSLKKQVYQYAGSLCIENDNCRSNVCLDNRCIGSLTYKTKSGGYCTGDSFECESNNCNASENVCE
jgi:hypothetical protein